MADEVQACGTTFLGKIFGGLTKFVGGLAATTEAGLLLRNKVEETLDKIRGEKPPVATRDWVMGVVRQTKTAGTVPPPSSDVESQAERALRGNADEVAKRDPSFPGLGTIGIGTVALIGVAALIFLGVRGR